MTHAVDLSPPRFAALVAPAVTRVFVAGMRAGGAQGRELVAAYGGPAVGYLIDLRNPLAAGRTVTVDDLAVVYRYTDPEQVRGTIRGGVEHGLLAPPDGGTITPTRRGRAFLSDLFELQARVLDERWGPHAGPVDRLNGLLGRVLGEAAATAGPAWAVQAPPYEPDGTPAPVLLLNRLSTLRYHRADAHAAAWLAAGLTAAEMVAMPWGGEWTDRRREVERDTNVGAAAPYAGLTPDERLALLADLAALP